LGGCWGNLKKKNLLVERGCVVYSADLSADSWIEKEVHFGIAHRKHCLEFLFRIIYGGTHQFKIKAKKALMYEACMTRSKIIGII